MLPGTGTPVGDGLWLQVTWGQKGRAQRKSAQHRRGRPARGFRRGPVLGGTARAPANSHSGGAHGDRAAPPPSPSPPLPPPPPPRQSCRPHSGDAGSSGGLLPPHDPRRAAAGRAGPGRLRREKRANRAGGRGHSGGTHGCGRRVTQRTSSMMTLGPRPPPPPVPLLRPPPLVPG
ncbi:formin-like protein 5 [Mastomys coucha]|uniref:formin-like protein 5 n=1 Tax=Mastomys coucha TaxID=35658 RepID=UPI001261472C|nr:formin-like protein 5 [Mastomys coucha]